MPPQLGSLVTTAGTSFRLWAPHATRVNVLTQPGGVWDYNGPTRSTPLGQLGEYWVGEVPGVGAGDVYRYELENGSTFEVLDPAARDTLDSWNYFGMENNANAAIIQPPLAFDWAPFRTPAFENFVIFQLHVGTFSGRGDALGHAWGTFRDLIGKLDYVRALGFTAIELLPIQEFSADRSWGYNPALLFALESSYGEPDDLRALVNAAHLRGLAVLFDVVYNHVGPQDNSLWQFDGYPDNGGIYFEGGQRTDWGLGPAWWKSEVQEFFYQSARMYFVEYGGDGLRFDATTQINGNDLAVVVDRLRRDFPDKYLIAEHLPADPWITTIGRFCATWQSSVHHESQRALAGQDSLNKLLGVLGWDGFGHPWNLVRYLAGSHDDVGDQNNGNAERGLSDWDTRHRYLIDQLGGREDWHARAQCRLAWALNVAMPGTPMSMMGSECLMGAPNVGWGYWHDGSDANGDHRFDWGATGDAYAMGMRALVRDANAVHFANAALRSETLRISHLDPQNQVFAFKRWTNDGNVVLTVVNAGENNFEMHSYGVRTDGQYGRFRQVLCSQDAAYGGWDGSGNAYYEPVTESDGCIYVNLPKWSVLIFVWLGY